MASASTKRCCTCHELKELSAFGKDTNSKDGLKPRCKACRKKETDPVEKRKYNQRYWKANKPALSVKAKEYRESNVDAVRRYQSTYRENNREKLAEYRKENAGYMKAYNDAYKPRKNEWVRNKRASDVNFRIATSLRGRFHEFVKGGLSTFDVLGMTADTFRRWLEFQFEPSMSWENYATEWEIDHVLPVSRFDFSDPAHQRVCFGWTNFQPKAKAENREKRNKIYLHEFFNCFVSAHRFIQNNRLGCSEYQRLRESVAWLRKSI